MDGWMDDRGSRYIYSLVGSLFKTANWTPSYFSGLKYLNSVDLAAIITQ